MVTVKMVNKKHIVSYRGKRACFDTVSDVIKCVDFIKKNEKKHFTKEKAEQIANNFINAINLINSVDKEIKSCNLLYHWHIFRKDDFLRICDSLGLKYSIESDDKGYNKYSAKYKGLEIISLEKVKEE
jgi:hypothetical protein